MSSESKNEARSIEHTLRSIYNCSRYEFGGNIDQDLIEASPVQSYILGLAPIYVNADKAKRKNIDTYIENLYQYAGMPIEAIGIDVVQNLTKVFETLIK
ncbi:hypothetical protein LGK95_02720 [Clostridium algoriphilum]|uniref:hypothetical protein n=1 Tax=Clostridium algoriphilum TaxID=198347 RepID=UPI001CF31A11|nr:hypothetical protein [Clostridium algoriphilum]MCB2292453.1 hypothetical protein [Clostridium algoriphilum]